MTRASAHKFLPALALACALLAFAAARASAAATYNVDTGSDNGSLNACTGAAGDCSLRGALGNVNGGAGSDTITFNSGLTITIGSVLPAVAKSVVINGVGDAPVVQGNGTYTSSCGIGDWALDITGAAVSIREVTFHDVCGRAIKSLLGAPTIQVGPRRADNTVPINGAAPDGAVEIFSADAPAAAGEASEFFKSVVAAGGGYAYVPPVLPAAGDKFTATVTSGGKTSGYAATATTPSDLTSPVLQRAVAISNNAVRLDFNETLGGGSSVASAYALTMANLARGVVSASANGNSVFLTSNFKWATGEAGTVSLTGNGRVSDLTGNEALGLPSTFVFAGPGELSAPVLSKYKVSPTAYCQNYTSRCKRKNTYIYVTLNKASRVVFEVYKKKSFIVKFIRNMPAGTTKIRLFGSMNGRTMPVSSLTLRATPEDAARNRGATVSAPFRVVRTKAKL